MPVSKKKPTKIISSKTAEIKIDNTKNDKLVSGIKGHPIDCKCMMCPIKIGKALTPILIGLLIIAVFFIGILIDRVIYLSSNNTVPTTTGTTGGAQAGVAQPNQKVNVGVGNYPALGNKNAPIKIIEFADLRCPFCENFYKQTEPQIISDYVNTGKAAFYFRNYAFLGPASIVAANAAECANEQGKFWAFHNYMYDNQPSETDTSMYNTTTLTNIAGQLGMNTTQFQSCLSSNKYQKSVDGDLADGQKAGVNGTPTLFINGYMLVGALPYSSFKTAIDCISGNGKISVDQNSGTVTCNK